MSTTLLLAALAPIWMVTLPPLDDYPNHLARMHVLANGMLSESLGEFYAVRWAVIPNLAMDIIVPPLAHFMTLDTAGRVFITLVIALLASGVLALHYVIHERLSPWPWLVFLLLYNGMFLFGILNFLLGLGLCLWAVAAWIRTRERPRGTRAALFYATCLVLFFTHLSAMGIYALSVIAYEASHAGTRKISFTHLTRWPGILIAGPLVLVATLAFSSGPRDDSPWFVYGGVSFAISQKLGAFYLLVRNYVGPLDVATLGLLIWMVVFTLLGQLLHFDRHMRWPALALTVAGLCLPYQVMGSNYADSRVLLGAAFFFVCVTDIRAKRRHLALFGVLIVALFSGRMLIVASHWRGAEALHSELSSAVELIPRGSRLLSVSSRDPDRLHEGPGPHLAATAVIRKDVFLPSMYAMPRGQPLVFTERYLGLARNAPKPDHWTGDLVTWRQIEQDYDFILLTGVEPLGVPPPSTLMPVAAGSGFQLYKTRRALALWRGIEGFNPGAAGIPW